MDERAEEKIISSQDIEVVTELLRSPDIEARQLGARMLAKVALSAVETETGSLGLIRILESSQVDGIERNRSDNEDRKSFELYQSLVEGVNDIIFSLDLEGNLSYINSVVNNISGYDSKDLIGLPFDTLIHSDDLPSLSDKFKETLLANNKPFEFRIINKNNDVRWMRVSTNVLLDEGKPCGIAGLMMDITDRIELEEKLVNLSLVDSLTGLYSRNHLEEQSEILKYSRSYPISVINIDVDGLHDFNNTCGHLAGDVLLKSVGQILKDAFRPEDCVARAGGDEFVVLLPNTDGKAAQRSVERIKLALDEHNKLNPNFHLSLSIGIATAHDTKTWDETLKNADERMYDEKKKNNNGRK